MGKSINSNWLKLWTKAKHGNGIGCLCAVFAWIASYLCDKSTGQQTISKPNPNPNRNPKFCRQTFYVAQMPVAQIACRTALWAWPARFAVNALCLVSSITFPFISIRFRNPRPHCRSVAPLPFPYRGPTDTEKNSLFWTDKRQHNAWNEALINLLDVAGESFVEILHILLLLFARCLDGSDARAGHERISSRRDVCAGTHAGLRLATRRPHARSNSAIRWPLDDHCARVHTRSVVDRRSVGVARWCQRRRLHRTRAMRLHLESQTDQHKLEFHTEFF